MGTRHLTIVVLGGEYKVCQYGQWDGYPSGQGDTVLQFLSNWDRPKFKAKVAKIHALTADEIDALNKAGNWKNTHPHLSRDVGAEILQEIQDGDDGIELFIDLKFAGDSLMCEWAYLIDLDRNNLEVYRGLNKEPLTEKDRFHFLQIDSGDMGYQQIKMVKSYYLSELPTVEQMEIDCRNQEEIEEAEEEENEA